MPDDATTQARRFYEALGTGELDLVDEVLAPDWQAIPALAHDGRGPAVSHDGRGPAGFKQLIGSLRGVFPISWSPSRTSSPHRTGWPFARPPAARTARPAPSRSATASTPSDVATPPRAGAVPLFTLLSTDPDPAYRQRNETNVLTSKRKA